jgi:nucleotide-binding universal stress UspA family protein
VNVRGQIVVGYDGSASSAGAVRWAADEALMCGARLCVLTCYSPAAAVDWTYGAGTVTYDVEAVRRVTADSSTAIVEHLRALNPVLRCTGLVVGGSPRDALVEASEDAALLVVGRSGAGAVRRLLVGSVAQAVARHSHSPVVIVPTTDPSLDRTGVVVVGVDGSPAAGAALAWASQEAIRRKSDLVVVHAWTFTSDGPAIEFDERRARAFADAKVMLNRMLVSTGGGVGRTGRIVEGSATAALLQEASAADLLVVGSRGRSGLRSLVFGSVAHAMTEHAPCPTVVVHAPAAMADAVAS